MTTYKYTYFNVRARGEVPRMLFAQAEVKFEDIRVQGEGWQAIKPSMPFEQIPVLETEGQLFCQSRAISRLLARRFGLAGRGDLAQTRADMIVDCCQDTEKAMVKFRFYGKDESEALAENWKKEFEEKVFPAHLKLYERLLTENKGGDGWFVGDDVTWADMFVYQTMDFITCLGGVKINYDAYPKLKAHKERLEKLPRLAEWFESRPQTNI